MLFRGGGAGVLKEGEKTRFVRRKEGRVGVGARAPCGSWAVRLLGRAAPGPCGSWAVRLLYLVGLLPRGARDGMGECHGGRPWGGGHEGGPGGDAMGGCHAYLGELLPHSFTILPKHSMSVR